MTSVTTKPDPSQPQTETAVHLFDNWFDPIEACLRDRAREFLQAMLEGELAMVLARSHYARRAKPSSGDAEGAVGASGQAKDQDADRAAFRRNRGHAVLGAARFRSDQHAQSRWMADARHKAH